MMTLELLTWLFGALIGSMLFFAAIVAPTVFQALPAEHAGKFLRRLFPRYYLWGLVLALACTVAAFGAGVELAVSASCVAVLAGFVYARQILLPAINRARDLDLEGDREARRRFRSLHLQSVIINAVQLIVLTAATVYLVWV